MSVTYIPAELRRLVVSRAEGICEYCLIAEADTFFGCAADHIISEKHGGATDAANLAYACVTCNQAKGSDLGSIDWATDALVRFFHPRRDKWSEHFRLRGDELQPLTPIGIVTARILGFNSFERRLERRALIDAGCFPPLAARQRM